MPPQFVGSALFVVVFVLYLLTFSSTPTSDGYTWVATIDQHDWDYMLLAAHPLPLYVVFVAKRLLAALGLQVATLAVIQTVNATLAATGAVLFYRVIALLSDDVLLALMGAGLLAASFGCWYFANGEIHHFGLVLILAIFLLVVRRRWSGKPAPSYRFAAAMGLLNALAIVFHQDAVLFGFAATAMLAVGCPWRAAVKNVVAYVVAGSGATAALATAIGVFIRGLGTTRELLQWYFWPTWAMGVQMYDVGGVTGSVLRSIKAQLTALVFGTQVMLDVARKPALLADPVALGLFGLTLVAYGVIATLLLRLWRERGSIRAALLVPFTGCLVWLATYKLFLHSWFQPASTEYHVVTVPPLILLMLLGPIAARAGARRWRAGVVTLLAIFVAVNFWGAILPWYRYGQMKDSLAARFQREVQAGDLFISAESGIDSVFAGRGRHVGIKDLFKQKPKAVGFMVLAGSIRDQLNREGRVFVYNFTPNPFTLRAINLEAAKRGDPPVTLGDFEHFLSELQTEFGFVPVLSYWEESKSSLFLYGRRFETLWEIRAHS